MDYEEIDDEGLFELPPTPLDKIKRYFRFLSSPKFLITLGILLAIYAVVWAVRPPKEEVFYKRGIIYSRRGLFDRAEKELKLALNENPDYAEARYELALVNMSQNKFDEARKEYSKVTAGRVGEREELEPHKKDEPRQEDTVAVTAPPQQPEPTSEKPSEPKELPEPKKSDDRKSEDSEANVSLRVNAYLGSALSYMTEEKFDKAELQLQRAEEIDDDTNADIYRLYGRLYTQKDELGKAIRSYQKALALASDSVNIELALADGYFKEKNFDKAAEGYRAVLEKEPDNIVAHGRLGDIHRKLGRDSDAENEYKKILELDPTNGLSSISLARLYVKKERYQDAIDELEKAIKSSPTFYSLYLELMSLYNRMGKYDSTIVLGDIADRLLQNADMIRRRRTGESSKSQNPEAYKSVKTALYTNLGIAYFRTGDYKNASTTYEKLRQIAETPLALANLGHSYLRQNDPELLDEAMSVFERSIELDQNMVKSYIGLTELFMTKRDLTKALYYARKAVSIKPDDPRTHYFLSTVYFTIGRNSDAIRECKRSIEIFDAAPARVHLALIYSRLGKNEQAMVQYKAALKLSPNDPTALNNLALLYLDNGRRDDALKLAQKAVDLRPDSPALQDTLGWIYYAKGDYKNAVEFLSKARKKLTDNPEILYHVGMAYYKLGEYGKAQASLEKVLVLNANFENAELVRKTLIEIKK